MYTNAQSLSAHKDEIHHLIIAKKNPALVALTETRLTQEIDDIEVSVLGYSIVRCDGDSRNTGGAVICAK